MSVSFKKNKYNSLLIKRRFLTFYTVLRKVSVTQPDEQSINFTQMVNGTPVESSIPKDIIVEIYKVVGNYRRQ